MTPFERWKRPTNDASFRRNIRTFLNVPGLLRLDSNSASTRVLELLKFDSNSNTNIVDFFYYFIILIGIEFVIKFNFELGAVFYY